MFVGRERELEELRLAFDDSSAGRGRLVLIGGEPGIGKTRLADEYGTRAQRAGTPVLWGRCWEGDGAPSFWPWVQILRGVVQGAGGIPHGTLDAASAARIAQIAPELVGSLAPTPDDLSEEDPDRARFRLFDAIASFLRRVAATRPLVVVLDDLHRADHASLLLLEFVAAELRNACILVLGLYRDGEAWRAEHVRKVIGDLARTAREMTLAGFGDIEIRRFISETTSQEPAGTLVRTVQDATGGNPFFVTEIVRLLRARGRGADWTQRTPRKLPLPPSVRVTIRRRVDTLPETSRELLTLASVLGREFDLVTLQRASGLEREDVLERLGDAVAGGFAERVPDAVADYRFSHDLVRETVYDDTKPAERVRLHRHVGEAIEELHGASLDAHATELAHHFTEAAAGGDAEKAVAYSMRAGERATASLAHEEAVEHFQQARRLVELHDLADDRLRFEILLALGEAQKRSGELAAAKASFRTAAELAEALDSADGVARVALGFPFPFGGFGSAPEPPDEMLIGWLRRAVARVSPQARALRARLLSRLSIELYFSPALEESLALSDEAARLARAAGVPSVLTGVLMTRVGVLSGTASPAESLAAADEVIAIAEEAGNRDVVMSGRFWRIAALFGIADRNAIEAEIAAQARLAEALREPRCRWLAAIHRTALELVSADSAAAEGLARHTLQLGEAAEERMSEMIFGLQMLHPLRERGRLAELTERYRPYVEASPAIPVHRAVLAWLHAELGHEDQARHGLDAVAAKGFTDVPRDLAWSAVVTLLAEVCDRLGDVSRAELLYDLMLPFATETATVGPGLAYLGSFAHYLGVLARRLERWQASSEHFDAALEIETRMGAARFLARTQLEYALLLRARDRTGGDRARAQVLLERAAENARSLEMQKLLETVESFRVREEIPYVASSPASGMTRSIECNVFRREGDYWTIRFQGEVVRLRDLKGLAYISHLLREPGRELHAVDLVILLHPQATRSPLGDAGEVLDDRARAAYRSRLVDLRSDLDEAERHNDVGRAERAREEIDRLGAALSLAVGLGGRSRRASSDAERARLMVTQRIRGAIRRIGAASPALGRHLELGIRTGSFCSYAPPSPTAWDA